MKIRAHLLSLISAVIEIQQPSFARLKPQCLKLYNDQKLAAEGGGIFEDQLIEKLEIQKADPGSGPYHQIQIEPYRFAQASNVVQMWMKERKFVKNS